MARARRAVLLYHSIVAAPERHLRAADYGTKSTTGGGPVDPTRLTNT